MASYIDPNKLRELDELKTSDMGVVKKDSAIAMSDTARSLVIGLGGMGGRSAHDLKKTLLERIGKIPSTSMRFLAIDTSATDLNQYVDDKIFTQNEIELLHNNSLRALMSTPKDKRPATINDIWPPDSEHYNPVLAGDGAGAVRLSGRISIMDANTFQSTYNKIKNAIVGLENFAHHKLEVHIIAGTAGGSGSGLIIDIPYLVRMIAAELNVPEAQLSIFGHIFMPNAYGDELGSHVTGSRNGYAALKEIDYYMTIDAIGETYNVSFPGNRHFSSGRKIFDFCYLIGGKSSANIIFKRPKAAAISACVANMVNQVTKVLSTTKDSRNEDQSYSSTFTSQAFADNLEQTLSVVMSNPEVNFAPGGNYNYAYIGSSQISFPTYSIIEYFVGTATGKMMEMLRGNVSSLTKKDVDIFAKNLIAPDDILETILTDFNQKVDTIFDNTDWSKDTVKNSTALDIQLKDAVNDAFNAFDKSGTLIDNAISRANGKAKAIFTDLKKGPFYLETLLTADVDTGSPLNGYFKLIEGYAKNVEDRIARYEEAIRENKAMLSDLAADMQKLGRFKKGLTEYKKLLCAIYTDQLRIKLLEKLNLEYYLGKNTNIGACARIKNTLNENYRYFSEIIAAIEKITSDNAAASYNKVYGEENIDDDASIFDLPDESFEPLKQSVRHMITAKLKSFDDEAVQHFSLALLKNIMENPDAWRLSERNNYGDSACADSFRSFIKYYPVFAEIIDRNFTYYLEEAYKDHPEDQKNAVVFKLMDHLNVKSAPLVNTWPNFPLANVSQLGYQYVIIPSGMNDDWGKRFKECIRADGSTRSIFISPDQNAIYNYTMYAAMPIWIHADLIEYEKNYYALKNSGIHINENPTFKPSYKKYPALMVPDQWFRAIQGNLEYSNEHELKVRAELKEIIDFSVENGILVRDTNEQSPYVVRLLNDITDTAQIDRFVEKYSDDYNNYSDGALRGGAHLFDALCAAFGSTTKPIAPYRSLRPDSVEHATELIRKQMKLFGAMAEQKEKLCSENSVFMRIEKKNLERKETEKLNDIFKFMLYGLINGDEMGRWNIHMGEKTVLITAKGYVSGGQQPGIDPAYRDYMEMAVATCFGMMPKHDEYRTSLNRIVKAKMDDIYAGRGMEALKASFEKYTTRASEIVEILSGKETFGGSLTLIESKVKVFYEQMIAAMKTCLSAFSA